MSTSIFIKTYRNDLVWLEFCLRSIEKFGSGFEKIILVADESCRMMLNDLPMADSLSVSYFPDWPNGYIQQQAVKLQADTMVKSENILFVDSDVVFFREFTPETFFMEGKPILLKIKYSDLTGCPIARQAQKWRGITESYVNWPVEWEYMRRMPIIVRAETLVGIRKMFPDIIERLKGIPNKGRNENLLFSEFNVIGAFIEKTEPDKYFIADTNVWLPPEVAKQYWSWGGLTPEIRNEIEAFLK